MTKKPFAVQSPARRNQRKRNQAGPRSIEPAQPESTTLVSPLVRGLAILASFSTTVVWQKNKQIALQTGLPVPTVSRLLKSLVALGYLCNHTSERKYRLAAPILGLGYAAAKDKDISQAVHTEMQEFAELTDTYVTLCARDRFNLIVVDSDLGSQALLAVDMTPGTRFSIGGSLAGAALLAMLPEQERLYFFERLAIKGGSEWDSHYRRIKEKISQVLKLGFCTSPGEWVPELSSISVPLRLQNDLPWVLSCTGRSFSMPPSRLERELGPKLVALARKLQKSIDSRKLSKQDFSHPHFG